VCLTRFISKILVRLKVYYKSINLIKSFSINQGAPTLNGVNISSYQRGHICYGKQEKSKFYLVLLMVIKLT